MPTDFTTIRSVGGLLTPDLLRRIAAGDPELGLLQPADYGLAATDRLGEAAARAWARAKAYWAAFRAATQELPAGETGTTETRQQWLLPLLRDLGYRDLEFVAAAEQVQGRAFLINYRAGGVPLHLISCLQKLDEAGHAGSSRQAPPHALLQDYLNQSAATYGIVSNGLLLRLLRDNASLTRQAYVEFDLEGIFDGGVYADYFLLYLVLHRSRLPGAGPLPISDKGATAQATAAHATAVAPRDLAADRSRGPTTSETSACPLELWRARAESQGTRALDKLREGVEQAVEALGNGFLRHRGSDQLRQRLASGDLTALEFYAQLLRLIYRLIFLFAAEERDLLFPEQATARGRTIYRQHYAASPLRELAPRQRSDDRHDDLWRGFLVTCRLVAGGSAELGLPALGGGLFDAEACPDLDPALINNDRFAQAIIHLSWVRVQKLTSRVNYRNMDTEELGGVYEGLLDRQPQVTIEPPSFELVGSGQRKQTGSYYTPKALVQVLIGTALDPVIEERLGRDRLLAISVCDAACGSGHFLLAAARRLADRLARLEAGANEPTPPQLQRALREVIRNCLYGVDANPLAVDLCKLALWLEGQSPGLPLTFLDHRVKLGNSLIGATPELLAEGLPDGAFAPLSGDVKVHAGGLAKLNRRERQGQTSAIEAAWERAEADLATESARIAALPEGEVRQVAEQRSSYRTFDAGPRETARAALDAWTAAFFWPLRPGEPEPPLSGALRAAGPAQPPALQPAQAQMVRQLRERHRFFHWPLEFPEVFKRGGFDCVLGNPPWERIKLQEQEFFAERDEAIAKAANKAARERLIQALPADRPTLWRAFQEARAAAEGQSKFVRASGRFPLSAVGDVNLYPLFAEHDRTVLNSHGRAGVIVPTGIATDDSTKKFFQSVVEAGALATLYDFENREGLFPAVDSRYKFCLLTLSGRPVPVGAPQSDLAFMLTGTGDLHDARRRFQLGAADFALLNPNTLTCPIFRTRDDAELTRAIYRRVPVLIDERTGANPWGVRFATMFHMSNDSGLFRSEPGPRRLPLYEAKLFHQFNHRWATYEPWGDVRDATPRELADPGFAVTPRYWVDKGKVEERLKGKWGREWLLAFRDIARNTDERTAIFSVLPRAGVGNNAPLLLASAAKGGLAAALAANLASVVFDYSVRPKVGGTHLNFFLVNQLAVLPPSAYTPADLAFIVPRVLELVYTAWDLQPFARDLGYDGEPFAWDEERRAVLRAELDAWYAALYGLTRDELRYVLDPSDVYGPEFPGETFRVLKEREVKQYGEYRTRRLVLAAWDRLGLEARMREGRYAVEEGDGGRRLRSAAKPRGATAVASQPSATSNERSASVANSPLPSDRSRPLSLAADRNRGPAHPSTAIREQPEGMLWQSPLVEGAVRPSLFDAPATEPIAARPQSPPPSSPAELRRLVVERAVALLAQRGPQSALELAARLAGLDPRMNTHLVANVLQTEGATQVGYEGKTGKYWLRR